MTIADRIRTSIRTNDFAARLGGDEFVFIVDKAKSEMEILATAYRMLDVIAQPVAIAGQEVTHTASIGIAMAEPGEQSGLDLLGWADVAMYAAKARGRNQAVVFDRELREEVERPFPHRVDAARGHRDGWPAPALPARGRPAHRPGARRRGARSLGAPHAGTAGRLGVHHGRRGDRPGHRTGPLGLRRGLPPAGRSGRREYPDLPFIVRINMSPADFKMGDLVEFVERCLRENNVPGNRLCIEITEYAVMDEPERIARILKGSRPSASRSPWTTSARVSPR